jgi:hypothetical protein
MFLKKNRRLKNYSDLLKRTHNLAKDVEFLISDLIESENCFMPNGALANHFSQLLSYDQILKIDELPLKLLYQTVRI